MTYKIILQTPVLPVPDVVQAQEYYRDVFKFKIDWIDRDVFGGVSHGDISIFFSKSNLPISVHTLVWNTPDADEVYKELLSSSARILEPIETRSWGMREFVVEDLNGHRFRVGHVDESSADYSEFRREGES